MRRIHAIESSAAGQPDDSVRLDHDQRTRRRMVFTTQAGKAILLISAELEEILNLADRIAVMFEGRIVGILPAGEASPETIAYWDGLAAALALCLAVDHASMASLVWSMALAGAALAVAFTLSWRPRALGVLVAWVRPSVT